MHAHIAQALKNRKNFDINIIKTQALTKAVKTAHMSTTAPSAVMVTEELHKWAKRRADIRNTCSAAFTEEEISLYECRALTSWESR